jgi:hypothetical protein
VVELARDRRSNALEAFLENGGDKLLCRVGVTTQACR